MVLLSTRELDEGISGKVISGIGGSFRRNPQVVEQLVEADAARENTHFGTHLERHQFSGDRYPKEINSAMKKVWFAYGDLGYDGVNGGRAKRAIENMDNVLKYFENKFGEQIEE